MTRSAERSREIGAVAVLALGFGLVGIDRFLISTLFPLIAHDLKLGYSAIGTVTGALAFAWGIAALLMGNLFDRTGRRRVLVGALLLFSLLISASGLATGLASLVLIRIVMGFGDGTFTPASISATSEAPPAERRGRNIGIQQMTLTLLGLGLSPLIVAGLLYIADWRLIFSVFVLASLVLAWLTSRVIPERNDARRSKRHDSCADWRAVLSFRNIRVSMVAMLCWLTCLVATSALMPSYLMDHLGFGRMGAVMSAIGLGAAAGTLVLPWISDLIGRKPVMLAGTIGVGLSLVPLASLGPAAGPSFLALFLVRFFNALITITVGPLCAETVPPTLMATASGVVIAIGELFGGGPAPVVAGHVAERFGIDHLLWLSMSAMAAGFLLCLFLRETRSVAGRPVPDNHREPVA